MKTRTTKHYSPEVRERAVRMVSEHQSEYGSEWAAIQSIAAKIGCTAETLRRWLREAQKAVGGAKELVGSEPERIKALGREVRELRQANEILRKPVLSLPKGRRLILPRRSSTAGSSHERVHR
jgi:transposase